MSNLKQCQVNQANYSHKIRNIIMKNFFKKIISHVLLKSLYLIKILEVMFTF